MKKKNGGVRSRRNRGSQNQLEFPPNTPVLVTLLYDKPKTGQSQRGPWYRYAAQQGYFFASSGLHAALQANNVRKGDTVQVSFLGEDRWQVARPGQALTQPPLSVGELAVQMGEAVKEAAFLCREIKLHEILPDVRWTPEDVRAFGITLFLESRRRCA